MIRFPAGLKFRSLVAVSLAVVYFLFQVEPFETELLENHRGPAAGVAFAKPSTNWESFDKSNAPKAFTADPYIAIGPLHTIPVVDDILDPYAPSSHPVRDKSPPGERA